MIRNIFHSRAFRSALLLSLVMTITLFVTVCVSETRGQNPTEAQNETTSNAESGVIDGVVTGVEGDQLTIAGGIVIDVSKAAVFLMAGERFGNLITPGMTIRASIVSSDPASSTLVADTVRVRVENEIVVSGPIQAGDFESGFITVLSKRIVVNSETSLPGGFKQKKLRVGLHVSVIAKPNGTDLEAKLILPNAPLSRIFP